MANILADVLVSGIGRIGNDDPAIFLCLSRGFFQAFVDVTMTKLHTSCLVCRLAIF